MANPVAANDIYTVTAGTDTLLASFEDYGWFVWDKTLLANDTSGLTIISAEGETLSDGSVKVEGDNGGFFTISADGEMSFDATSGFEGLAAGETITTSVTYTVQDADGNTTTAEIFVTIQGRDDDAVQAVDDTFSVDLAAGSLTDANVITDSDFTYNGIISVQAVNGQSANVGQPIKGSAGGQFTIASDGTLTFDDAGDFAFLAAGQTATTTVSYTVVSDNGEVSTANANVVVTGVDDAIQAIDDAFTVNAGTVSQLGFLNEINIFGTIITTDETILKNDRDLEGDTLVITAVNGDALVGGTVTVTGDNGGAFTVGSNGTLTFDASTGFERLPVGVSEETKVTYTVEDGNGTTAEAEVIVTVIGQNDAVKAFNDYYLTTNENEVLNSGFNVVEDNDWSFNGNISLALVENEASNIGQPVAGSNGGYFTIDTTGLMTFDPNGAFEHILVDTKTSIQYTVTGENGESSTARVEVTVTAVNDPIVTGNDLYTVDAGSNSDLAFIKEINIFGTIVEEDSTLLSNDIDVDGNSLVITKVDGIALVDGVITRDGHNGGTFMIASDGTMSFDASTAFDDLLVGQSVATQVTYTVVDAEGEESTADVIVTVNGTKEPLVASTDSLSTDQNTDISLYNVIQFNDVSELGPAVVNAVNGDQGLVGAQVLGSKGGLFTIDTNGNLAFDPNGNFNYLAEGDTEFTSVNYTITDSQGNFSTASVLVTVTGLNDDISVTGESYSVNAGDNVTLASVLEYNVFGTIVEVDETLLSNDVDTDGDTLLVSEVNGQALVNGSITLMGSQGGTFTITENGSLTFDSGNEFNELAIGNSVLTSVNYTVTDSRGETGTATVEVRIEGTFDPSNGPVANDDEVTFTLGNNNITVDILANDQGIDPDNDAVVTGIEFSSSINTVLQYNSIIGEYVVHTDPFYQKQLALGESIQDIVSYEITDANGNSDTADVLVNIYGVNDAPELKLDGYVAAVNEQVVMDVLANDTEWDNGDTMTIVGITNPFYGTASINAEGTAIIYNAPSFMPGTVDVINYTVEDSFGAQSTQVIYVGINPALQGAAPQASPVVANDDIVNFTIGDAPLLIDILGNDEGIDKTDLSVVTSISHGGHINGGGLQYGLDNPAFPGEGYKFYADPVYNKELAAGEIATDLIEYTITDANGVTDTATLTVNVIGVNDAPVAADYSLVLDAGVEFSPTVEVIDFDNGDNATIIDIYADGPDLGLIYSTFGSGISITTPSTFTADDVVTLRFIAEDMHGAQSEGSFTVRGKTPAVDTGLSSAAVVATDDAFTITADLSEANNFNIALDVLGNDQLANPGDVKITGLTIPNLARQSFDISFDDTHIYFKETGFPAHEAISPNVDNLDEFVSGLRFYGDEQYSFTLSYSIEDSNGNSSIANLDITYQSENDAPSMVRSSLDDYFGGATDLLFHYQISKNTVYSGDKNDLLKSVIDNDFLAGDTVSVQGFDTTNTLGQFTEHPDGTITYDPTGVFDHLAAGQSFMDSVDVTFVDNHGATHTETMTVTVLGSNFTAPEAQPYGGSAQDDLNIVVSADSLNTPIPFDPNFRGVELDVLANDAAGSILTGIDTAPGSIIYLDQTVNKIFIVNENNPPLDALGNPLPLVDNQYTHLKEGETATETFTYSVIDASGNTDTATATVTVVGVNDAPYLAGSSLVDGIWGSTYGFENTVFTATTEAVLSQIIDPEGESLSIQSIDTSLTQGLFIDNLDGTFSYDPNGAFDWLSAGQAMIDTVNLTVADESGGTVNFDFSFYVFANEGAPVPNNAPTALGDDAGQVLADRSSLISISDLLVNDSDPDGDSLTLVITSSGGVTQQGGSIINNGDGTLTYNPNGNFDALLLGESGVDEFTYLVEDSEGALSEEVTVSITVNGVLGANGQAVIAGDDTTTIRTEGTSAVLDFMSNDYDLAGSGDLELANIDLTGTSVSRFYQGDGVYGAQDYLVTKAFKQANIGQSVTETFTYTVRNDLGDTDTATVTITGEGVGTPFEVGEQAIKIISLSDSSSYLLDTASVLTGEYEQDFTYTGISSETYQPGHLKWGTLTDNGDGTILYEAGDIGRPGDWSLDEVFLTYEDANGTSIDVDFWFYLVDMFEGTNTGTNSITANDDVITLYRGGQGVDGSLNVLSNDQGISPEDNLRVIESEFWGPTTGANDILQYLYISESGQVVYNHDSNGVALIDGLSPGEVISQDLSYTVVDDNGNYDTATLTVNIEGSSYNDKPRMSHEVWKISENTSVTFDAETLMANDFDPETDVLVFNGLDLTNESYIYGSYDPTKGSIITNPDGSFTYDPTGAFDYLSGAENSGSLADARDYFTYEAVNGNGVVNQTIVMIDIFGVDDPIV